jgi:hypothetical protein
MGEWLDRALMVSPVYYALCTTEAGYHKILKGMGVDKDTWPPFTSFDAGGTTHFFTKGDKVSAVVCVKNDKSLDKLQIYALLVHEAVHIWQEILQNIHEKAPSQEFEAYSIQKISQNLMYSYDKQTKPKKVKNGKA